MAIQVPGREVIAFNDTEGSDVEADPENPAPEPPQVDTSVDVKEPGGAPAPVPASAAPGGEPSESDFADGPSESDFAPATSAAANLDLEPVALPPAQPPAAELEAQQNAHLEMLYEQSLASDPERAADVYGLHRRTAIPADIVAKQYESIKKQWEPFDASKWKAENPIAADIVTREPEKAGFVMADEPLSGLSRVMRGIGRALKQAAAIKGEVTRDVAAEVGLNTGAPDAPKTVELDPAPQQVAMEDNPAARGSTLDKFRAQFARTSKGLEHSEVGYDAMAEVLFGGGDDSALVAKGNALDQELGPIYLAPTELDKYFIDAANMAPSLIDSAKTGMGGMLAGGFLGLATRSPAVVAAGAALGGKLASFGRSFQLEAGGFYLDALKEKGFDGLPIDRPTALAAAALYGTVAATMELADFETEAAMYGPLVEAMAKGEGKAFLKGLVRSDRGFAQMLRDTGKDLMKRQLRGATGEAMQEMGQEVASIATDYLMRSSNPAGGYAWQPFDWEHAALQVAETGNTTFFGTLLTGPAMAAPEVVQHWAGAKIAHELNLSGNEKAAAITQAVPESPTARAAPETVDEIVQRESARSGQPVVAIYADPVPLMMHFQSEAGEGGNVDKVIEETLGEGGAAKLKSAVATGQKVQVGIQEYAERWSKNQKLVDALADNVTTQPGHATNAEQVELDKEREAIAASIEKERADIAATIDKELEDPASMTRKHIARLEKELGRSIDITKPEARASLAPRLAQVRTQIERFKQANPGKEYSFEELFPDRLTIRGPNAATMAADEQRAAEAPPRLTDEQLLRAAARPEAEVGGPERAGAEGVPGAENPQDGADARGGGRPAALGDAHVDESPLAAGETGDTSFNPAEFSPEFGESAFNHPDALDRATSATSRMRNPLRKRFAEALLARAKGDLTVAYPKVANREEEKVRNSVERAFAAAGVVDPEHPIQMYGTNDRSLEPERKLQAGSVAVKKRGKPGSKPFALRTDIEKTAAYLSPGPIDKYFQAPPFDFVAAEARISAVRQRVDELAAEERSHYRFEDRNPNAGPLLVSQDPSKPGQWRMTYFGKDGTPYGHQEAKTRAEAIKLAHEFGADLGEDKVESAPAPKPDKVLFQDEAKAQEPGPLWHSAAQKAAEGAKQAKGDAKSWLAVISKTPGVKQEELDVIGLPAWLDQQKGSISKEEVTKFIAEHQVQVKEKVLGEPKEPSEHVATLKRFGIEATVDHDGQAQVLLHTSSEGDLTDLNRIIPFLERHQNIRMADRDAIRAAYLGLNQEPGGVGFDTHYPNFTTKGATPGTYRELLLYVPGAEDFRAPHFGEKGKGLTAHARVAEHTLADGTKALLVEEIQSDLHQQGREKGYAKPVKKEDVRVERPMDPEASSALESRLAEIKDQVDKLARENPVDTRSSAVLDEMMRLADAGEALRRQVERGRAFVIHPPANRPDLTPVRWTRGDQEGRAIAHALTIWKQESEEGAVPDAPFKKTWEEMLTKRVVRYAAEKGYEKIAWTTGATQADRYNLAKHVDEIRYNRATKQFGAYKQEGGGIGRRLIHSQDGVKPEDLAGIVGADAAKQLLAKADEPGPYTAISVAQYIEDFRKYGVEDVADPEIVKLPPTAALVLDNMGRVQATRDSVELAKHEAGLYNQDVPLTIETRGLSFGGEGMKQAYDRRIPSIVEKLVKKEGGEVKKERLQGGRPSPESRVMGFHPDPGDHFEVPAMGPGLFTRVEPPAGVNVGPDYVFAERPDGVGQVIDTQYIATPVARAYPTPETGWIVLGERGDILARGFATKAEAQAEADRMSRNAAVVADMRARQTLPPGPEVWTATLPAQLREKVVREGQPLFQENDGKKGQGPDAPKNPRGVTGVFAEGAKKLYAVMLNRNADLSTFLHESSHIFLEQFADLAARPDAPQSVKDDYAKTLKWFGVESRDQVLNEHHEKWAGSFEKYLLEGKAPSIGLERAFEYFRTWLKGIYGQLQPRDANLNDEIRGVFDRLLATDAEIAATRERMGLAAPLFTTIESAKAAGMDPADWPAYLDKQQRATSHASRQAEVRVMKDRLRAQEDWWKKELARHTEQASKDYERLPGRQVELFLRGKGLDENGEPVRVGEPLRLKTSDVVKAVGEEGAKKFLRNKDGMALDDLADILGQPDGKAALEAVLALTPKDQWVKQEADAAMREGYPEILQEKSELRAEVEKGFHGDETAQWLAAEWKALRRGKTPPIADVKKLAQEMVPGMKVSELRPHVALQTERSSAEKAAKAVLKKDYAQAAVFKQKQLLNMFLYRETRLAKEELDAARDRLQISEAVRGDLGKADPAFRDVHDSLLAAVGLGEQGAGGLTLDQMLKVAEDSAEQVDFDVDAIRQLLAKPKEWGQLTVEQARNVVDASTNIRHLARRALEVEINGKRELREDYLSRFAERVAQVRKPLPLLPPGKTAETLWQKVRSSARSGAALLENIETLATVLDGGDHGPAHELFIESRLRARDKEVELTHAVLEKVKAAAALMPAEMRDRGREKVDLKGVRLIPGNYADTYTRDQLRVLFLNSGNEGNLQRLRDGNKLSDADRQKVLNLLEPEEAKFLQGILDTVGSLYPDLAAAHEKRTGLKLGAVKAKPIVVNGTEYPGGYYPIKYRSESRQGQVQDINSIKDLFPSTMPPATKKGHTKARLDTVFAPLDLEWSTLQAHLANVIHDIAYTEWVKQTAGIVMTPRRPPSVPTFAQTVTDFVGKERERQVAPWLRDVASARADSVSQGVSDLVSDFGGFGRRRLALGVMGFNLPVLGRHSLDGFRTILEKESIPVWRVSNAYRQMVNPLNWSLPLFDDSREIGYHHAKYEDNMRLALGRLGGTFSAIEKFDDKVAPVAFAVQHHLDKFTTRVAFKAAYDHATAQGLLHPEAVKRADDVVRRAFPSGDIAEKPPMLRTKQGWMSSLMFMGWANNSYNALARRGHDTLNAIAMDGSLRSKATNVALLAGAVLASGAIEAMGQYFAGRGPPDDKDLPIEERASKRAEWALEEALLYPSDTVPVLGPAIKGIVTGHQINATTDPSMALIADYAKKVQQVFQSKAEEKDIPAEERLFWALETAGATLGFAGFSRRTIGAAGQIAQDKVQPRGPIDAAGQLLYGVKKNPVATPFSDLSGAVEQ